MKPFEKLSQALEYFKGCGPVCYRSQGRRCVWYEFWHPRKAIGESSNTLPAEPLGMRWL